MSIYTNRLLTTAMTSINVGNQHIELDTHALTEYMYIGTCIYTCMACSNPAFEYDLFPDAHHWRIHGIHGKPVSCRCMSSIEERSVCFIYISFARGQTYKYITTSMQGFLSGGDPVP